MFSILERNGAKRKVKLSLFKKLFDKYTLLTGLIVYFEQNKNIFN